MVVFEDFSYSRVVEGVTVSDIRSGYYKEGGIWVIGFGFEEDIGGLFRSDNDYMGIKGFDINSINIYYC